MAAIQIPCKIKEKFRQIIVVDPKLFLIVSKAQDPKANLVPCQRPVTDFLQKIVNG